MNFAKEISRSLVHIFFPHVCAGCGNDWINNDQLLCIHCLAKLPRTNFQLYANNPVEKIFWGRAAISSACCQYYYTKNSILQQILHDFKYNGKKQTGIFFGQIMGNALIQSERFNHIEALVPLPLFPAKEKKRGYNQAAILSEGISSVLKIPVFQNAIARTSSTETQTHKNRMERWQNMSGKFEVKDRNCLEDKHILLVDDVITTGATLDACANELLLVKGTRVSIATLAYTADL